MTLKTRKKKKDSLSPCKTPTPSELFTLPPSDFTPGWRGTGAKKQSKPPISQWQHFLDEFPEELNHEQIAVTSPAADKPRRVSGPGLPWGEHRIETFPLGAAARPPKGQQRSQ